MNKYFSVNDKVYDIVEKNPKALEFLVNNGFDQFKDPKSLEMMGKKVSLSMALKLKKMNVDLFEERLLAFLDSDLSSIDTTLVDSARTINLVKKRADINIEGVLPCPIRIPLLEGFQSWLKENKDSFDYTIGYELQSANLGLDWIKDQVKTGDVDQIPDVLMSAGFDLFFDKTLMGQFMDDDVFDSDLMIFPTEFEGLPRVLIEAMACSLPCIATNVNGIPELLQVEDMFEVGDFDGFYNRAVAYLESLETMEQASARNFEIAQNYEYKKLQNQRLNFFKTIDESWR